MAHLRLTRGGSAVSVKPIVSRLHFHCLHWLQAVTRHRVHLWYCWMLSLHAV